MNRENDSYKILFAICQQKVSAFSQLSKIEERSFQTEAFPMLSNSSLMQNEDFPLLISASLITVHKLCSIGTNDFSSVKMNEKNFRFFFLLS